jgi:hypothetical protein
MKKVLSFLFALLPLLFSCSNNEGKKAESEKQSYELTKESLRDKEIKNPKNFLSVAGSNRHNIIGQMVIRGSVTNKASVASYKDVDVKLSFYSKTGALLETGKETVYEVINPGETKSFKTKYFAPKGSDSVALEVERAKSVERQ